MILSIGVIALLISGCSNKYYTTPKVRTGTVKDVFYTVPESWQIMDQENTDRLRRYLYYIPFKPAEGTKHSANASIVIKYVSENLKASDIDIQEYHSNHEGYIVVSDMADGKSWRSIMGEAHDEVPNMIYERIGVEHGIIIHLTVAFPLLEDNESAIAEIKRVTNEYNELVKSFTFKKSVND